MRTSSYSTLMPSKCASAQVIGRSSKSLIASTAHYSTRINHSGPIPLPSLGAPTLELSRRHRLECLLDVAQHPLRRVGHDPEVALAELGIRLAGVAPRAAMRRPVHGARRREEERGVDRRAV